MNKLVIHCMDCGEDFTPPFHDEELAEHRQSHQPLGMELREIQTCNHCGKEVS